MIMRREEFEYTNCFIRFIFEDVEKICLIIFTGSMDTDSILNLKERTQDIVKKREYDFVVDLSHVVYIGSTGLGYLAFLAKYRKNFLFLSAPPEEISKPFKLLEMEDIFRFYQEPHELLKENLVPETVVPLLVYEIDQIRDIQYHKRWVKILRDYLSHDEVIKEIKRLTPYIKDANESQKIFLPSELKYTCILYKFLDRAFNDVAKIGREKVDDATLELIAKELMTNSVRHGYGYRKDGVVQANYEIGRDSIEIRVIDYGKGFLGREKEQELPRTGLELLKKIFDEVAISEAPKEKLKGKVLGKGTMVKMVKKLKT
jgi:anti-anti-sigma factor